ncbi:SH3 and multiple ankyrin repeat domains protein 3-like isoform X1 [Haliotis rufescens]|uniref:SH3 and multiple ankyrin repeat domains protein 3-like isoform X1 n=1 Tax=Haliotis rufescens TaxID=6454 RepID=UPI00201F83F8|nr:SH3 and multiple ankyrin repeat domains protein 3-like isoform X1 [Haliotis rufescens]XP_046359226.2 SH3 and multiple ankyrin repeat domains protein 3-like isoform X1 [Haliotis rufescens]XP_046359227.2 SH3 and multiple ankyrin repeat domains protein 3-like isoform X1 [Haliotis rufescens]XP_046359228.2 SH3 and multiple ankyrin repeat domains protein 3-like isoform X1 [Haliotis rufescens]XP_046359229.2 SH3 and multiple ankyrin repeat domains protein 3-like isoform X1 [Haliotis rufescens]XP_04
MGEYSNYSTYSHCEDNSFTPESQTGTVYIRIAIPELKIQKCLQFQLDDSVYQAKQRILAAFSKDLRDSINYGLYLPPTNGRAGKFLDEERLLQEYPLQGPIGFLEFKYKRRVYKVMQINPRKLKQLHTKSNLKHFIELVKKGDLDKINKLTSKGLDPNFHDHETGETPLTLSIALSKEKSREMMIILVSGGAHLDFRNKQGLTPLHKAAGLGILENVKTLLDLGASPNYKDLRGLTPLYYAVCNETNPLCTEMLLHERAFIGLQDEQGWFEIHQACKYGHVQHLEHLLYYGADMDVQNASGNTPLHVCAVFNQESCARVLLFRGCSKEILNYNNQTAFQIAIIANNIDLAEIIKNNKPEDAVPFREVPKYSDRRKGSTMTPSMRAIHRSRSDPRLNISVIEEQMMRQGMSNHSLTHMTDTYSNGSYPPSREYNSDSPRSLSVSSTGSGPGVIPSSQYEYERTRLYPAIPSRFVVCVKKYQPIHTAELKLRRGDIIQVLSVGDQGYYEGRTDGGREGWFPGTNVKDITLRRAGSMGDLLGGDTVTLNRNTLAALINADDPEYAPRRVVLHKGPEGFGFVLRGARSQTQSGTLDFQPTPEFPALQYLDSVDQGSQADRVGLKAADFLLEINGENVVRASHERVVQLIRTARSTLAMTVVTVRPLDRNSDWFVHQDGVMTLPNRKRQAPAPPRRDPQTSLSYSKATSKSMAEGLAEIEKLDQTLAEYDGNQYARRSSMPNDGGSEPKTASVRAAHSAKRMSVVDLDTILVSEKTEHGKTKNKDYVSPSELRIMKYHKKQNGTVSNMERSKSTPDLAGEMVLTKPEAIYARSGVAVGSGAVGQERPGPGATWSKSHVSPVAVKTPEPSSLRGPIYMTPSVKRPVTYIDPKVLQAAVSSGSASKLHLSQDEPPYSVPQIPSRQPTPKRPAPPPPPVRAEVVSISTTYANVSEDIQKKKNRDSPYESSFRPGTLARLTKHPQVTTASLEQAKLKAHQRSASAGNIAVPPDAENETDKPGVSFAEDKVYESAASFMEKHPNATLLVTADVHKGQKKEKNIYEAEPEPDYDVESDEEKAESVSSSSSTKVHGTFSRQSSASSHKSTGSRNAGENKTVISVGGEGSQKNSPQNKRYTIHSDIPSSTAPFSNDPSSGTTKLVIPPRPQQPAPLPPSVPSSTSSSRRSSVQSNMSGDRDTSSDRINIMPPPPPPITSIMVQSSQPVTTITSHTTPPPQTAPPPPPPPPPVVATPPPPPPPPPPPASNPPPLPSSTPPQLRPTAPKPVPQGPPLVPTDDIMAAVAKRQARMQSDGPLMAPDRPAPAAAAPKSKLELNHEALKAAVAKRKNLLAKVDDSAVVDTIESRLQKTKKLQSAKYFFSSDTINRKDVKAISPEIAEEKHSVTPSKVPVGSTNTLKSKKTVAAPPPPVMKPAAEVNAKATQQPKEVPSKSVAAKETPASVPILTKSDSESPQPSDFLALAEKRRQEWLQKKSNGTDTGTLKKNTTTQNPTSTDSNTNKIEVIPLKGSSVEKDSKVSIRDRIAKLEKANLNLNGAVKSEGNVELGGVTEDHSHTEAGLTLSRNKKEKGLQNGSNYGYVAPPTEFEDGGNKSPTNAHGVIQIDIIPPPPIFANESSTDESGHANEQFGSAFGHDDAASLVSSVSTLSTLSSEHGEAGSPPAKHAQQYDDMIPPPPPGFDDLGEQMYDEIQGDECIPPPPQFGNSEGGKPKPIRPFQTKAVESWLCTDVMDWLDSVSMSQYRSSFAKNCIDGPKLLGLGRNDYIELGVVQVGHRMNLERSIKKVAMRKTAL